MQKNYHIFDGYDISDEALGHLMMHSDLFFKVVDYRDYLSKYEYSQRIELFFDPEDRQTLIDMVITLPRWSMELEDKVTDDFLEQFPDEDFSMFMLSFE